MKIKLDEFESIHKGYKQIASVIKKVASVFNDGHVEYKSERREKVSIEQYFKKVKPYLGNNIDELIKSGEWKINLTMKINFMSSKDMHFNAC